MDSIKPVQISDRLKAFWAGYGSIVFCLLLIMATSLVYWQVKRHEFVNFDDGIYVSENQNVKSGLSPSSIKWAFGFTDIAYWHPLTWLSHMLDVQLYGLKPGLHHTTNLIIHILNALLLFIVLKRMTGDFWQSGFVAALFALHPINVESVAWVAERKNVLSTFFWMLTLLAYGHYSKRPGTSRYVLTLALFTMGLMSKPFLVTMPFVLLMLDFWPLGRIRLARTQSDNASGPIRLKLEGTSISSLVIEKLPFLVLAVISVILSILSFQQHGDLLSNQAIPFHLRVANAIVSYMGYIGKAVWPHKLAVFYPYPDGIPVWLTVVTALWLISTTVVMIYKIQRFAYLAVGWLWYIVTLGPSLGLIQAGLWPAMADRWAYIPLIGIFIIAAWGVPELAVRWRHRRVGLAAGAMVVLFALSTVTSLQVRYWANNFSLYRHALDVTHNNDVAHNNLGAALYLSGNIDEALVHFIQALRIVPEDKAATDNLFTALSVYGKNNDPVTNLEKLIRVYPQDPSLHFILGNLHKRSGNLDKAIEQYQQALAINPAFLGAINNLAVAYALKGDWGNALSFMKQMISFQPENPAIYYSIASVLARQNKVDDSIKWLNTSIRKGFKDKNMIKNDHNFENIRKSQKYEELLKRM